MGLNLLDIIQVTAHQKKNMFYFFVSNVLDRFFFDFQSRFLESVLYDFPFHITPRNDIWEKLSRQCTQSSSKKHRLRILRPCAPIFIDSSAFRIIDREGLCPSIPIVRALALQDTSSFIRFWIFADRMTGLTNQSIHCFRWHHHAALHDIKTTIKSIDWIKS